MNNLIFLAGLIQLKCVEPKSGQFVTIKRIGGMRKNLLVLCEVLLSADKKTGLYFTIKRN